MKTPDQCVACLGEVEGLRLGEALPPRRPHVPANAEYTIGARIYCDRHTQILAPQLLRRRAP